LTILRPQQRTSHIRREIRLATLLIRVSRGRPRHVGNRPATAAAITKAASATQSSESATLRWYSGREMEEVERDGAQKRRQQARGERDVGRDDQNRQEIHHAERYDRRCGLERIDQRRRKCRSGTLIIGRLPARSDVSRDQMGTKFHSDRTSGKDKSPAMQGFSHAGGGTRTPDTRIMIPLL
jgi:hypothetical protein